MTAIFLSASVPRRDSEYYETAEPFLIQAAVRELVKAVINRHQLVWGGHPAITPMVWSICQDMDVEYSEAVVLYQSKYFQGQFPDENQHFNNVIYVDGVDGEREASLRAMRQAMLSRDDLVAAVFIGGMEGVVEEYRMFRELHPQAMVLAVPAPGGAARELVSRDPSMPAASDDDDIDFAALFRRDFEPHEDE